MNIIDKKKSGLYILNQVIQGFRKLGFRYFLLLWLIVIDYLACFIKSNNFIFKGKTFRYFYGAYNHTWLNERTVEIPIMMDVIKDVPSKDLLEIGNVLKSYFPLTHKVVDKYEKGTGIINEDAIDFKLKERYSTIICISTLEHVGWDEIPKDSAKIPLALSNMKKHLKKKGKIVISVPVGYNPYLDNLIFNSNTFNEKLFLRRGIFNTWTECSEDKARDKGYIKEISAKVLAILTISS